jgi:hypothetical protein
MKKFTCLLIALLAINAVYTQNCAAALIDHTFYQLANQAAYGGTGTAVITTNGIANAAAYCDIATNTKLCCTQAGIKTTVNNELKFIRDSLINYAAGVARVGAMWSKVSTLVNATNTSTLIDAASAPDRSGATADQIKTWIKYDNVTFDTDFKGFKDNAVKCFESYALAANAVACDGCTSQGTWDNDAVKRWTQDSTIGITVTTCDALVTSCARVWYFMHRFGWFAQSVALVNKKRESTSGSVTYSPVDYTELYAPGVKAVAAGADTTDFPALTVIALDALNTAIAACGGAATPTSGCDAAAKVTVCRSFFSLYTQGKNFGRSDTTFIGGTYNPVSTVARRELVTLIAGTTGATRVSATNGIDGTVAAKVVDATTNKIDSTAVSAWSTGYSSSSGSSSSASSKSAKVFIGTILSALFAVAFLN